MDDFAVFDEPDAPAPYAQPTLLPLIRSFAQQRTESIATLVSTAGHAEIARLLRKAAVFGTDAETCAQTVSNRCWHTLQAGRAPSSVREAYALSQLILGALADTPLAAAPFIDRAFILGGSAVVRQECIALIEEQLAAPAACGSPVRFTGKSTEELDTLRRACLGNRAVQRLSEATAEGFRPFFTQNRPVI